MVRSALGVSLLALTVALAACASDDDDDELPLGEASRVRELPFLSRPKVTRRTRESYIAEREAAAQAISDAYEAYLRGTLGRLGYFGRDFDLRASGRRQAGWVGAFYDSSEKQMTLFEDPAPETVVHELVHALQDQHFDLRGFDGAATSSDEALAHRALVEGDATLAELRFALTRRGRDPVSQLGGYLTASRAFDRAQEIIERSELPAFFSAYPALAYFYGGAYAARTAGLWAPSPFWSYAEVDALFHRHAPDSTQEVLRAGEDVDPIVPVGLDRLPEAIADRYDVESVDRLGEWYTYLLLREPERPGEALSVTRAWDGDQLVVLQERDTRIPREPGPPVAVVWTTVWDDGPSAARFVAELARVQGVEDTGEGPLYRAGDGERVWLEAYGDRAVFVKNLETEDLRAVANAALGAPPEKEPLRIDRAFPLPDETACVRPR